MSLYNQYRNLQWFLNTCYHLNSCPGAQSSLRSDPSQYFQLSLTRQTDLLAIPCACFTSTSVNTLLMLFVQAWSVDQQHQFYLGACATCRISGPSLDLQSQNLHFNTIFRWRICTSNFKTHCKTIKCFSMVLEALLSSFFPYRTCEHLESKGLSGYPNYVPKICCLALRNKGIHWVNIW